MCAVSVLAMNFPFRVLIRALRGWNKNWRCVLNQSGQSRELRNLVAHGEIYLDILDRKRMISKRNLVMVYDCPLQQAVKKTVRD